MSRGSRRVPVILRVGGRIEKARHSREIIELNTVDAEPNPQRERQIRRRKYGSGDGDQHLDDVGDAKDGHFSLKDEKYKEERYGINIVKTRMGTTNITMII